MKVWVIVEEDRGCGFSVEGVFTNEANANKARLSRQYVFESEIIDTPDSIFMKQEYPTATSTQLIQIAKGLSK